jgi:hypothetical protein
MLSDRLYRLNLPPCTREDSKFLPSNRNVPIARDSQFHPITANLNDPHFDSLANHNLLIYPSTEYQHLFTSEEPKYMGTSAVVDENAHHVAPSLAVYTLPQARRNGGSRQLTPGGIPQDEREPGSRLVSYGE